MEENIKNDIISVVIPFLIPTPYVGSYDKKIELIDNNYLKQIFIGENSGGILYTTIAKNIDEYSEYILEILIKTPESIIIYNSIFKKDNLYNLQIRFINGNKKINYIFHTNDKNKIIKLLYFYSNTLKDNKIIGFSNVVDEVINNLDKTHKIKTKRKNLFSEN